ncbi:MAG: tRNA lysidine(34) synthetase TilS [Anaerolineae bacterium]
MSTLNQTLAQYFNSNLHLQGHGPLVVAVSGGRDSICLLHWLTHSSEIKVETIAVTIDHGLRPESAFECKQVLELATEWGAECQIKQTLLTPETFTENSGRIARYAILKDAARQAQARFILTGHHAGDQAESVLLHLLRGAGLTGLTGMRDQAVLPKVEIEDEPLVLVRPMLNVSPAMLDQYAAEHDLNFFDDPSNKDKTYTRNRIRHTLIPLLEKQFNPQIQKSLSQMAEILKDDLFALEALHASKWEQTEEEQGLGWCSINFEAWSAGNPSFQRYALRQLYARVIGSTQDMTQENLEAARVGLSQKKTDKRYQLSGSVWVQKAYDTLLAYHKSAAELFDMPQIRGAANDYTFDSKEKRVVDFLREPWQMHICPVLVDEINLEEAVANRWVAFLAVKKDADLILRSRQQSEAFRPFKFDGDVYLKKLMIDRKIPAILRDRWPLIADETGILWVAGHRLAARAAITAATKHAVRIEIKKSDSVA